MTHAERDRRAYRGVLNVKVEQIHPFGVFVRLEDGTQGYIRRRELSLSGDIDPAEVVELDEQIKAVALESSASGPRLELSHKATLPDPWKDFVRRNYPGNIVQGTVKDLLPAGIFVEIVPGVKGFVPREQLATWKIERPEDFVWRGDIIEAEIVQISAVERLVRLSIRERLLRKAGSFLPEVQPTAAKAAPVVEASDEPAAGEPDPLASVQLGDAGPVLVVEDEEASRDPFIAWLADRGCVARGAKDAGEALVLYASGGFRLLWIDLDLPVTDGLDLIRQLEALGNDVPIVVSSDPDYLAARMPELQQHRLAAIFPKPLDPDETTKFLGALACGERPAFLQPLELPPALDRGVVDRSRPEATASSGQSIARLQSALDSLARDTGAETAVLFRRDSLTQAVRIVAQAGTRAFPGDRGHLLLDSPVRDVIDEERPVWENQVTMRSGPRFAKLLMLVEFDSCIGIPIEAAGRTDHALFLFDRAPDAFPASRLREARVAAVLLAAILERQALEEQSVAAAGVFLSGQLAAGFGHEVNNKLQGLDFQFSNLRKRVERVARIHAGDAASSEFTDLQQALERAVTTANELSQAVTQFGQLMKPKPSGKIDVNQQLRLAEMQLRPLARRARAEVKLILPSGLPPVLGSEICLYQVLVNLMLNAIQQMELKGESRRLLKVTTAFKAGEARSVCIRFADSGPGIHRRLWDKVFDLGFTTRPGGSGLGLFISRRLIEDMGGAIAVEESLMALGTTFAIRLPQSVQK